MGLKQGTLESLVESGISIPIVELGGAVFHQMLQAIDCLAMEGIIHRDVKPENILYVSRLGQHHFQLGDFGFCNHASIAATFAGSPLYMAPEMFQKGKQTHKVDVWSLFVTMLWTLDVGGFRMRSDAFRSVDDAQKAVLLAASTADVSNIQEMARANPDERASAAQMLVKCFNGTGLTTPRHRVTPLGSSAKTDDTKAPAPAAPALVPTSRARPKTQRGFQRNVNPGSPAAAGQFGVKRGRLPQIHPRLPISPASKTPGQTLGPMTTENRRVPGSFPDTSIT
jgi:serine/threonine protein kinase